MAHDVSVIGLYILDVLGRPVTRIPDRGNVDFIEEIRLTVAGTAALIEQTGEHPAQIKDRVASPGGTTIAGLAVLEQRAVRGALIDAVVAAADRARVLGRPSDG